MSLSLYADYAADPIVSENTEPRWREVHKALKLALLGYLVSTTGAALALFLVSLALQEWAARQHLTGKAGPVFFLLLLGVAAVALATVAGYALLLIGHWSCLVHAPVHPGARGMMLACLTCFLVGLVLHMAAPFAGGVQSYETWQDPLERLKPSDLLQGSALIHVVGCGLWLVSAVAFSQFLRSVAACFNDAGKARSLDTYLLVVSLLLGASIGLPLCVPRLGSQADLVFWLAGGWFLCYVWYLLLIARVRSCILKGLEGPGRPRAAADGWAAVGQHAPHTLSGLHRLCQVKGRRSGPWPCVGTMAGYLLRRTRPSSWGVAVSRSPLPLCPLPWGASQDRPDRPTAGAAAPCFARNLAHRSHTDARDQGHGPAQLVRRANPLPTDNASLIFFRQRIA